MESLIYDDIKAAWKEWQEQELGIVDDPLPPLEFAVAFEMGWLKALEQRQPQEPYKWPNP